MPSTDTVLVTAYRLLGDGAGHEWDENPEYTRAIAELVGDLVGTEIDPNETIDRGGDGWKPTVLAAIRQTSDMPKDSAETLLSIYESLSGAYNLIDDEVTRYQQEQQSAETTLSNIAAIIADHETGGAEV